MHVSFSAQQTKTLDMHVKDKGFDSSWDFKKVRFGDVREYSSIGSRQFEAEVSLGSTYIVQCM